MNARWSCPRDFLLLTSHGLPSPSERGCPFFKNAIVTLCSFKGSLQLREGKAPGKTHWKAMQLQRGLGLFNYVILKVPYLNLRAGNDRIVL